MRTRVSSWYGHFFLLAMALSPAWAGEPIYVSLSGNDTAAGTLANPVRTLAKASTLVAPGGTIRIRAGTYRETGRVQVAGTAGQPITIEPEPGETVIFSGCDLVTGWTAVGGGTYQATIPTGVANALGTALATSALNQTPQVFANGIMLHEARFPNATVGELFELEKMAVVDRVVDSAGATIVEGNTTLPEGAATPWGPVKPGGAQRVSFFSSALSGKPADYWKGATLFIIPRDRGGYGWAFGCIGPIEASATDGKITAVLYFRAGSSELQDVSAGDPIYVTQKAELLDANGEWHLDEAAHTLRLRMPDGGNPGTATIELKRRDYALDLSGSSYVTVKNLRVHGATITTDNAFGKGEGGGMYSGGGRGAGHGSGNASAHHITLDGISASYISHVRGTWGYPHGQWVQSTGVMLVGEDHVLTNSTIEYSAGNGVVLFGPRHTVRNNVIHDVSYSAAHTSGIFMAQTGYDPSQPNIFPTDIEIANNTLYRGGWGLIDASKLYSSSSTAPARIHHNRIDAPGLLTQDVGGIRMVGTPEFIPGSDTIREPPIKGTRIDHNWISGCVSALGNAIYFDFCIEYRADHNLITDSNMAINYNEGGNLLIANNTGHRNQRGMGGLVSGSSDPNKWRLKGVQVRNNLLDRGVQPATDYDNTDPTYTLSNNLEKQVLTSHYRDPDAGDFRLKTGSPAINTGIAISGITDGSVGVPDIGAFELGQESWLASVGADFQAETAPTSLTGTARADGTVTLRWSDNATTETGYVIERLIPITHRFPGWEARIVARLPANTSSWTGVIDQPGREVAYRVRTNRSGYSRMLYLYSGKVSSPITFESAQGYTAGNIDYQGGWLTCDGGDGLDQARASVFSVAPHAVPSNGNCLLINGTSNNPTYGDHSIIYQGSMSVVDAAFIAGLSSVSFSLDVGLLALDASDTGTAAEISIGGAAYFRSDPRTDPVVKIVLKRNGQIVIGSTTLSKKLGDAGVTANANGLTTLRGQINLAAGTVTNLSLGGATGIGTSSFSNGAQRTMSLALWQIAGFAKDAAHGVRLDNLSLAVVRGPANIRPTITPISSLSTPTSTPTFAIPFVIGDDMTAPAALSVSAVSANTTIVDAGGIVLGGTGTDRTITLTPKASVTGETLITITVTDSEGASTTEDFLLTVSDSMVLPPSTGPGDVNADRVVNASDFAAVAAKFGLRSASPGWDPAVDTNGDGVINATDFANVAANFGNRY